MADDGGMDTNTKSAESPEIGTAPVRTELVRPVAGRTIGGVAAGLAAYLNISVGFMRAIFLIAVIFGGLGFALYAAGWLLIRDETESESIAQRLISGAGSGPSWLGIGLLVLAAAIFLGNFTFFSDALVWALVLVIAGYLLYRGDIGGGRNQETGSEQTAASVVPDERSQAVTQAGASPAPPAPPAAARPVPSTPAPPPPPPPPPSILGRLILGVAMLALGILAVIDNLTDLVDPRPRHYLAVATVVLGIGLLTGAFVGRARWMILLGIFLVPPLLASPVAEVEWEGRLERIISPTDVAELQPAYETGAGRFVFNLTETTWDGENVDLAVDVAAGEIVVIVPEGVAVTGSGTVSIGQIIDPSGQRGGIGNLDRSFDISGDVGSLDLDLEVGVGSIRIETRAPGETGSWGLNTFTPATAADLADGVEQGTGDLTIDLRQLELDEDTAYRVQLGAGRIEVIVPDSLNVNIEAAASAGSITLFDSIQDGFGASATYDRIDDDGPVLDLDLSVGTGDIVVTERNN